MNLTRRLFLAATAGTAVPLAVARKNPGLKIGVTDWNLRQSGKVEAVALAKSLGFEGVEVSLGRKPGGDQLPLADPEVQAQYRAAVKKEGIRLAGTCLDILHVNCLKNDKLGQKWLADGIAITRKLDARVMLLPFFGRCSLKAREEMDYVADALKDLAKEAEKAKVVLGLENTISAEDNVRIIERCGSKALQVYYDVGNSTLAGFDPLKEIPWLGRDRICQFHLKDNPHFLGEGKIPFPAILAEIRKLKFDGFANLETENPTKSVENDMRRNLKFVRGLAG